MIEGIIVSFRNCSDNGGKGDDQTDQDREDEGLDDNDDDGDYRDN